MIKNLEFFADENIPAELIIWFQSKGFAITGVKAQNIEGCSDEAIIEMCNLSNQIILTQDNDFGKLIFTTSIQFYSIFYLRPGHFDGSFHIPTIERILKNPEFIQKGTLIIGQRIKQKIKIRIKQILYPDENN